MSDHAILVTGAAGFIGFHVARALLAAGHEIIGLDNLNAYYDPALKQARLKVLLTEPQFSFVKADLADRAAIRALFAERRKHQRFADALNRTFALRDELKQLPQADTIICRCEDVCFDRIQTQSNWRAVKLHTRCGMGPCQGRICGAAIEFLLGWQPESVRPPVFPVKVGSLIHPTEMAK